MSGDYLADSDIVYPTRCPGCSPELAPDTYVVHYCPSHEPVRSGAEDERVATDNYMSNTEAGGKDNRRFCDWLHRKKSLLRGPA
jgi:hypothetical protein